MGEGEGKPDQEGLLTSRRTARPGGAPLPKLRACKYGARRNGKCPPKPKSASSARTAGTATRSTKATGRPCKYGPRLANGRCPTKPKKAQQATRDIGTAIRPSSTPAERVEAVNRIGDQVAAEASKATARAIRTSGITKGIEQKISAALKKGGTYVAPVVAAAGLPVILLAAGGAIGFVRYTLSKQRFETSQEPMYKALRALITVEKNLKRKLTPEERRVLYKQHFDFFTANPNARA